MIPADCYSALLHPGPNRAVRFIQVPAIFETAGAGEAGNLREEVDQFSLAQAAQAKFSDSWSIYYGCLLIEAILPRRSVLARPDVFHKHLQQIIDKLTPYGITTTAIVLSSPVKRRVIEV